MTSLEPAAMTVERGLDFVLSHFEEPIWPRTIFTPKEKQILVYDKEEALARFRQAKLTVAFTQIGNNSVYLHQLHFLASFLYISWI
ncbi:MAG: hypothetical protein WA667_26995 [Candidatus Nitrosopolaris sp.]